MSGFRPRGRDLRAEPDGDPAPAVESVRPEKSGPPEIELEPVSGQKPAPPQAPSIELAIDPPSRSSAPAPRTSAPAPSLDLELPVPPPPTSKPALPIDTGSRSSLDELDEEDALQNDSLALDLDTGGGAPLPEAVRNSVPAMARVSAPPAAVSSGSLPPTSVREPAIVQVDPYDARALVDYEPAPDAFWMTPIYAYKILRRRAEVVRELADAKEQQARTEKQARDSLVQLGERLRPAIEAQGGAGLEMVVQAEQVLRSRDAALSSEMDAHKGRAIEIDGRIAQATLELGQMETALAGAKAELDAAQEAKARAEAKMKRAEIEMRNAQQVQGVDTGGEIDLANISKSVTDLQAQRDAHAAEHARHLAFVQQKELAYQETKRRFDAASQRLAAMRSEQAAENARFQRQLGTRSQGSDAAREGYENALAEVARSRLSIEMPAELEPLRKEAIAAQERAHQAAVKARQYETGIDSYEKSKVALGLALAITSGVILLILILFPFIYRAIVNG